MEKLGTKLKLLGGSPTFITLEVWSYSFRSYYTRL